jgi:hypothetical protein
MKASQTPSRAECAISSLSLSDLSLSPPDYDELAGKD